LQSHLLANKNNLSFDLPMINIALMSGGLETKHGLQSC